MASATPQQQQAEKVLQTHIQTVAGAKTNSKLYAPSFQSFLPDEKIIFQGCSAKTCKVKIKSNKMPHKIDLWKASIEVEISSKQGKKTKISQRPGCYFIQNKKLVSYMEDCEGR